MIYPVSSYVSALNCIFFYRPDNVPPKTVTEYIVKMFLCILSEVGVEKISLFNTYSVYIYTPGEHNINTF